MIVIDRKRRLTLKTIGYFSDVLLSWPIERQEALFREYHGGVWPSGEMTICRDTVPLSERGADKPYPFANLEKCLHEKIGRDDFLIIASPGVFAASLPDFLERVTWVVSKFAALRMLAPDGVLRPESRIADLAPFVKSFLNDQEAEKKYRRYILGGKVSGESRSVRERARKLMPEWALDPEEFPTNELLKRGPISLNSAKRYLGTREEARARLLQGNQTV